MKKRYTIRDIAQRAGVSVATVSNVINGIQKVSEETKQVVIETMAVLDYQPNLVARSLSKNRSDMIGLLLPITDEGGDASLLLRDNPFYGEFISGVENMATKMGYDVLIRGIRPGESCRDWIVKRNLDAAIFVGNYTAVISSEMRELNSRLVLVDAYDEGVKQHPSVGIDDRHGGYLATRHLLDLGHRSIAFAASNIMVDGAIYRRFQGYKAAMAEYGITQLNHLIKQDTLNFEGGYRMGRWLLEQTDKISAVFASADTVAFGIMKALFEKGVRIPEQLSIVGFDDTKACEYSNPALTSIRQPIYQKGMSAAETVITAIEQPPAKMAKIQFPVELIQRHSTQKYSVRK